MQSKTLRVRGDVTVWGPGSIKGNKTNAQFRLWLEVENLTAEEMTLSKPTLVATDCQIVVQRWYPEDDKKGLHWDGVLKPHDRKAVHVIGHEAAHAIEEGTVVAAVVERDGLKLECQTTARGGLHARCPCGCDRSDAMVAEVNGLPLGDALESIAKPLASIAERERLGYVTEQMITHRIRLLGLREQIQGQTG